MDEYLEHDQIKKTIKALNLDDFSIEDLNIYINELENEINRANQEILKKKKLKNDAQKFFK